MSNQLPVSLLSKSTQQHTLLMIWQKPQYQFIRHPDGRVHTAVLQQSLYLCTSTTQQNSQMQRCNESKNLQTMSWHIHLALCPTPRPRRKHTNHQGPKLCVAHNIIQVAVSTRTWQRPKARKLTSIQGPKAYAAEKTITGFTTMGFDL